MGTAISAIIVVPILIESIVEYGKTIVEMFDGEDKKTGIIQCITVILGILGAFAFNFDIFAIIGIAVNHTIGMVLTGILASRGSNYISDFIGKIGQTTVG